MKRLAAAGTFSLFAGLFGLLLFASIFYSCRSGGDPHHEQSDATLDGPPVEHARSAPNGQRASASKSLDGRLILATRR